MRTLRQNRSAPDQPGVNSMWHVFIATCVCMFALGCGQSVDAPSLASATLSWHVLPSGCERVGVSAVRVLVQRVDAQQQPVAPPKVIQVACSAKSVTLSELPHGSYLWSIEGLDVQGDVVARLAPWREALFPGQLRRFEVLSLVRSTVGLSVQWRWPEGHCQKASGGQLHVFDERGYAFFSRRVTCADAQSVHLKLAPGSWQVVFQVADHLHTFDVSLHPQQDHQIVFDGMQWQMVKSE